MSGKKPKRATIHEMLEKAISNVNWCAGHSEEYLSEVDAEKLDELWEKYMKSDN